MTAPVDARPTADQPPESKPLGRLVDKSPLRPVDLTPQAAVAVQVLDPKTTDFVITVPCCTSADPTIWPDPSHVAFYVYVSYDDGVSWAFSGFAFLAEGGIWQDPDTGKERTELRHPAKALRVDIPDQETAKQPGFDYELWLSQQPKRRVAIRSVTVLGPTPDLKISVDG